MNKLVIGILIAIAVIAGAVLLVGNKKTANIAPAQPATLTKEEEQQSQQASTFSEDSNTIILTQNGFEPKTLTVKVGNKVSWVNKTGETASVNSAPHPIHSNYQPLNLNGFGDGESLELIFDEAGTYNYHDHLNPTRTGTVIVE